MRSLSLYSVWQFRGKPATMHTGLAISIALSNQRSPGNPALPMAGSMAGSAQTTPGPADPAPPPACTRPLSPHQYTAECDPALFASPEVHCKVMCLVSCDLLCRHPTPSSHFFLNHRSLLSPLTLTPTPPTPRRTDMRRSQNLQPSPTILSSNYGWPVTVLANEIQSQVC